MCLGDQAEEREGAGAHGQALDGAGASVRYPGSSWYPGPLDKQGYTGLAVNECRGVICHSMVGSAASALARLEGPDRASWHFSVLQNGTVLQHYESNAVTWHAGSMRWNGRLIGIEHEGGAEPNVSEPLTLSQLTASVLLVRWLSQTHGFALTRDITLGRTLYEHNDVYQTACPSGRIPWDRYIEEDEDAMTPELKTTLDALYAAVLDQGKRLGGVEKAIPALAKANADSFKKIEDRLTKLEAK